MSIETDNSLEHHSYSKVYKLFVHRDDELAPFMENAESETHSCVFTTIAQ